MRESDTRDISGDETDEKAKRSISRRALLMGLFALPIATLDPEPALAQFIGIGPFRLHLGPSGGGYYRSRPRHSGGGRVRHSRGHGSRHASQGSGRRGRRGGGGGGHAGGGGGGGGKGLGKVDF